MNIFIMQKKVLEQSLNRCGTAPYERIALLEAWLAEQEKK